MLAAIGTWLASYGAGIVAKLLVDLFSSWLSARQADTNAKELGGLEVANKINVETLETKNAMDDVARPSDAAVADSLHTGKF